MTCKVRLLQKQKHSWPNVDVRLLDKLITGVKLLQKLKLMLALWRC